MAEEKVQKSADEKFCSDCGEIINIKAEICPKCGVRQMSTPRNVDIAPNGKSKITAALLALFLGGIGVHKFYLGQVGKGFLYLIFCWTFIPVIIAFIEFIVLLVMSNEDFNRKYGHS
ncbi:NINE protein [bacterium]|nr:NINE protein [bacterium]